MPSPVEQALSYKHVAVVGLSRDPSKAAHKVPAYLQRVGYKIYPVNPFGGSELLGEKVYSRVSDIDGPVDLVVVFRPSEEALAVVEDALQRSDVKAIWLQEGIVNEQAAALAEERGLIFVQDKCTFKEHRRLNL